MKMIKKLFLLLPLLLLLIGCTKKSKTTTKNSTTKVVTTTGNTTKTTPTTEKKEVGYITTSKNIIDAGSITEYTNKEFNVDEVITLTATVNSGYKFIGWYVGSELKGDNTTITFSIPKGDTLIVATYDYEAYNIELQKNNEFGEVSGSGSYKYKENVTITANPSEGYKFIGWYNDEQLISEEATYSFIMPNKNIDYIAKFEKDNYMVILSKNIDEAGSLTGNGEYNYLDTVKVEATTNDGYTFLGWYINNELVETEPTYTFSMGIESVSIVAKYDYNTYNITYYDSTNSQIAATTTGPTTAKYMSEVTYSIERNSKNYAFVGWFIGETFVSQDLSITFTMPKEDVTIYIKWGLIDVTVNNGNTFTFDEYYNVGDEVTITPTPKYDTYNFVGWYSDDNLVSSQLDYTFTITEDLTIPEAYFGCITLYSQNTSIANPEILTENHKFGDTVQIKVTMRDNYVNSSEISTYLFTGWYNNDNNLVSYDKIYEFTYTKELAVYRLSTSYKILSIRGITNAFSNVTSIDQNANIGDNITLSVEMNEGYIFDGWKLNDEIISTDLSYTFTLEDNTYIFYISATSYRLTISSNTLRIVGSIEEIGSFAFYNCTNLLSVEIEGSVKSINNKAFMNCTSLINVTFCDDLESIGISAFENCTSISRIIIPNSVKEINANAFKDCKEIEYISLGTKLSNIPDSIYKNCNNIKTLVINSKDLTTHISNLPDGFDSRKIYFNGTIEDWCNITIIDAYYSTILKRKGNNAEFYYLDESGSYIFEGKNYRLMDDIVIPNTITKINPWAFAGMDYLRSVIISDGVEIIGRGAFSSCKNLRTIVIPSSVKTFENEAFYNFLIVRNQTEKLYYNGTIEDWLQIDFQDTLSNPISLTRALYILDEDGDEEFKGNRYTKITDLVIPSTISIIKSNAFYGLELESITIEEGVSTIKTNAFDRGWVGKINYVSLPKTLINYEQYSFFNTEVDNIYFNGTIEDWLNAKIIYPKQSILRNFTNFYLLDENGDIEFNGNTYGIIKDVIVPSTVKTINTGIFYNQKTIETVLISTNTLYIDYYAFYECDNLNKIYYCGTMGQWNQIKIYDGNDNFTEATVYYYSETTPTTSGNYWHYDSNNNPVIWS